MNNKGFTAMEVVIAMMMLCSLAASGIGVWLLGSGITSGYKAATGYCGQEVGAEVIFNGDMFCPKEKD